MLVGARWTSSRRSLLFDRHRRLPGPCDKVLGHWGACDHGLMEIPARAWCDKLAVEAARTREERWSFAALAASGMVKFEDSEVNELHCCRGVTLGEFSWAHDAQVQETNLEGSKLIRPQIGFHQKILELLFLLLRIVFTDHCCWNPVL